MTILEEKQYATEIGRHLAETIREMVAKDGDVVPTRDHAGVTALDNKLTSQKKARLAEEKKRVVAKAFAKDQKSRSSK